jgi:hypothetical protein
MENVFTVVIISFGLHSVVYNLFGAENFPLN